MWVGEILKHKGSHVFTTHPEEVAETVLDELLSRRIGSAVVVDRWGKIVGIFSERDIVYGIGRHGAGALALPVSELMTSPAPTCRPADDVTSIMALMTHRRMRHVVVMEDGRLCGVVRRMPPSPSITSASAFWPVSSQWSPCPRPEACTGGSSKSMEGRRSRKSCVVPSNDAPYVGMVAPSRSVQEALRSVAGGVRTGPRQ